MATKKINKNIIRIIITVLVAVLTAGALAGGIYYSINIKEQTNAYQTALSKAENLEKAKAIMDKNPVVSKTPVAKNAEQSIERARKSADQALALKKDYQKYAITLYCASGILLAGNIFLNIKKKPKKSKATDNKNIEE